MNLKIELEYEQCNKQSLFYTYQVWHSESKSLARYMESKSEAPHCAPPRSINLRKMALTLLHLCLTLNAGLLKDVNNLWEDAQALFLIKLNSKLLPLWCQLVPHCQEQ